MSSQQGRRFRLNKRDKKVMGVCAGLADHFEVDVTLVRLGVTLFILATMPMGLVAYWIAALVADKDERRTGRTRDSALQTPWPPADAAEASRARMRDLDARLAALETSVKNDHSALAREIDALR